MNKQSVEEILSSLTPERKAALLAKLQNKPSSLPKPPKQQATPEIIDIVHNYICEFCDEVHTKVHPVKVTLQNRSTLLYYNRPLNINYICNKCKSVIVVGLSFALQMRGILTVRGGETNERRDS